MLYVVELWSGINSPIMAEISPVGLRYLVLCEEAQNIGS